MNAMRKHVVTSTLAELGWVMIGGGLTIFPQDREKISLELADLVRYDSGVLLQIVPTHILTSEPLDVNWCSR